MSAFVPHHSGGITAEFLTDCAKKFHGEQKNILAQNAVCQSEVRDILAVRGVASKIDHHYAVKACKEAKITNQKASGRCWLFAALNILRVGMMKRYKLPTDFELSQPYLFFWDKVEKANYFLENILDTLNEPLDGRLIDHLLKDPLCDGGQWDMLVNIINKYGLVPKSAYPESYTSSSTRRLNWVLTHKLRGFACTLRKAYAEGGGQCGSTSAGPSEALPPVDADLLRSLRAKKAQMLEEVLKIALIHLGTPPGWEFGLPGATEAEPAAGSAPFAPLLRGEAMTAGGAEPALGSVGVKLTTFDWHYRDERGQYRRYEGLDPLFFAHAMVMGTEMVPPLLEKPAHMAVTNGTNGGNDTNGKENGKEKEMDGEGKEGAAKEGEKEEDGEDAKAPASAAPAPVPPTVSYNLNDYVSVINDPRNDYYKTYTVDRLGNVVGGGAITYLNAPISVLKQLSKASIDAGEPVWFGCDVDKEHYRKMGLMDPAIFDYNLVYGCGDMPALNKEERLRYGDSLMTHAMVFTAYDLPKGTTSTTTSEGTTTKGGENKTADHQNGDKGPDSVPSKWRVENSWGESGGDKGFYQMSDRWFDEYMYQVVVRKSLLPPHLLALLDFTTAPAPVVLPPWDPMGALAKLYQEEGGGEEKEQEVEEV